MRNYVIRLVYLKNGTADETNQAIAELDKFAQELGLKVLTSKKNIGGKRDER